MDNLNQNYETKLKETIARRVDYERTLKKNETDQGFRLSFASSIIKGINSKYYNLLANAFEKCNVRFDLTYNKTNCYLDYRTDYPIIKVGFFDEALSFAHECGHLVDHYDHKENVTKLYTLTPIEGESLYNVLKNEFNETKDVLFRRIRKELSSYLEEEFGKKSLALLEDFYKLQKLSYKILSDSSYAVNGDGRIYMNKPLKESKPLNQEYVSLVNNISKATEVLMNDSLIKEFRKKYFDSESYKKIKSRYSGLVSDMLSSCFDLDPYGLNGHDEKYFKQSPVNLVMEFFAEFFSYKLTDKEDELEKVKRSFPKSYKKANQVFDYIVNVYSNNDNK